MGAEPGKRVTINFVCRREDGSLYNFTNTTQLSFVLGQKRVPPSLDAGIAGMAVGEQRIIRLEAKELEAHPLDTLAGDNRGIPATSGRVPSGYEFAPGNDGDIIALSQPRSQPAKPPPPPEAVLIFHVKMVKIDETSA